MTLIEMAMYGMFIAALYLMRLIWITTIKDNENEHK